MRRVFGCWFLHGLIGFAAGGAMLAACSSAPSRHQDASQADSPQVAAQKQAVLQVWVNAMQAWYGYLQQGPPPAFTAAYNAGSVPFGEFFPKLVDFERGQLLQAGTSELMRFWIDNIPGPTSYSLGHPTVKLQSATSAVVADCITTRAAPHPSSPPPPGTSWTTGGTVGGTWTVALIDGSWFVTNSQSPGPKC